MLKSLRFPKNTLFCCDAGFTGYELLSAILESENHFLIRVGSNIKLLKNLRHYRCGDGIVYLWPQESIAKMIADGSVVFDFYDETQHDYAFAGETAFDFHYEYRCATRYRMIDHSAQQTADDSRSEDASGRAIEVTLDYVDLKLKISHRMRLPSRLVGESFFTSGW
jgi:hypothetical protein